MKDDGGRGQGEIEVTSPAIRTAERTTLRLPYGSPSLAPPPAMPPSGTGEESRLLNDPESCEFFLSSLWSLES